MTGPVRFQHRFLRRKLWTVQQQLCRAVLSSCSTSVKGCHGSGKTYAAAGLVPWWLMQDPEAIVLTVAPTLRQVKSFWGEVHGAIRELPFRVPEPSTTGFRLNEKNWALGFSSSKGVNAQGFHGKKVLIIADEAVGISPDLWDAIEGIRAAGDVHLLKLCNPTVPQGAPYDDFTRLRATTTCITISAFDTPNLAGLNLQSLLELPEDQLDVAPLPWLTRRRWVKEMYYKWGPNNPRFLSRVLGEFPTQAPDAVFQLAWIERAAHPFEIQELYESIKTNPRCYLQVGIDVAGPGEDETACYARIGGYIIDSAFWSKPDPFEDCLVWLDRLRTRFPNMPMRILGDTVGIGFYFLRRLLKYGFEVTPFVAQQRPADPLMFQNMKAEACWTLRDYLRDGLIRGLVDEDAKAQLSDLRYREPMGRIEIEPKDEMRARGSTSPDRAEALVMAFVRMPMTGGQWQVTDPVSISLI